MNMKKNLIFLVIAVQSLLVISCNKDDMERERTESVIGTVCTVNAFGDGSKILYDEIFTRLHQIDSEFSLNIDTSDVCRINACAGKTKVSVCHDVFYVVQKSLYYAELSKGAFDPTIGPVVKLWNINSDNPYVPEKSELDDIMPLVNYRNVILDDKDSSVFLTEKGMCLDLGAIAKGYAADEIAVILDKYKVRQAVIDLGGNIYVYGIKKDKSMWNVGIKDPYQTRGDPALVLSCAKDKSIVTSGIYERFFERDGNFYHHILDTSTGYPYKTDIMSSTIIASSSLDADALSTISFILGYKDFSPIARKENVSWIYIDRDKKVYASKDLKDNLDFYNSEYSDIRFID